MLSKIIFTVLSISLTAETALAGPPQSVMIHTHILFDNPAYGTFTATQPLCASGVFTTTQFIWNPSQTTGHGFLVEAAYTCNDGSGTFNIQYHPHASGFRDPEFLLTGPWSVVNGGTGSYAKLTGHGDFGVVIDFDPEPWIGEETFVGEIQFK